MSMFKQSRSDDNPLVVTPWHQRGPFRSGNTGADAALHLSAVWACVRLVSDAVAMMPLEAFTIRNGERVTIPPNRLLERPSPDASLTEWVQMAMTSMLLRGNAYGFISERDQLGYATQIEPLHPDQVRVKVNSDSGHLDYTVAAQPVDRDDIVHIRGMRMPGMPLGLSPIEYSARTLATEAAAEAFGAGFFEDGAHPSAVLTTDQQVKKEAAAAIKERFKASIEGRDVAVLGAGVKYNAIQVSPEESQFLETQKFGTSQIARIFGVPAEMIGGTGGGSMTYSNVTQRSLDFLTYAVQPWLTRIEDAIYPLIPGARHVRFNTSALVRMTATDRWSVNKTRLSNGAATINEIRAEEGQPPVEWGNEPYLPAFVSAAAMVTTQDELLDPPKQGENK